MTKYYAVILLSSLYLLSCKSASKAYEKGNYSDAIEISVKKLQKDPDDEASRDVLKNAYKYAVQRHEDQIRQLEVSRGGNRHEQIYHEYRRLQNLYELVRSTPAAMNAVQARDYREQLEAARDKAVEVHVGKAEKWMSEETKMSYREAYREYLAALRLRPDDFELRRMKDEAYDLAITKVVVVPLDTYGGYRNSSYQFQNFQDDIIRTLAYNLNNEYVKFYTEWEARNRDIEPDQILELNLSRIRIGQPFDERSTREVSKEVVVREIVHKKDSVTKEYAKVYARITTTRRLLLSEGDLLITLRDPGGRLLWSDRFTGEHRWQTKFATYTGDERALSQSDRDELNQREHNLPREEEIMEELFRQIRNDLSFRVRNFYSSRY